MAGYMVGWVVFSQGRGRVASQGKGHPGQVRVMARIKARDKARVRVRVRFEFGFGLGFGSGFWLRPDLDRGLGDVHECEQVHRHQIRKVLRVREGQGGSRGGGVVRARVCA